MIRECIAGQSYTTRIGVRDSTTPDIAKINPSINDNDFLISINDGAWEALDNTPTVTPTGSEVIKVVFSTAETTAAGAGGTIVLRVADASNSDGWLGGIWVIPVRAAALSELTAAQVNAEADTALVDVGLTTTVTGRIDAAITSRLASVSYTAPDNTTIGTIDTKLGTPVSSVSADIAGVQSDTNDIQSRLPAALVGGRMDANTGAISGDATAADNLEAALDGTGGVTITAGLTGNVAGNLSGSVGSVTNGVTVATNNDKTGYALSSAGVQAVWEYSTRTLSSFGTLVADVWAYATRTLTSFGTIAGAVATVTGGTIVVYARDTWRFSINNSTLALSGYEAVSFVVKGYSGHVDNDAILYVRSDTGLVRIGGTAGTAGDGSLAVDSATQITVDISLSATGVTPGTYTWWIKGISTTPSPTTGYTLATGRFTVHPAGLQAIS